MENDLVYVSLDMNLSALMEILNETDYKRLPVVASGGTRHTLFTHSHSARNRLCYFFTDDLVVVLLIESMLLVGMVKRLDLAMAIETCALPSASSCCRNVRVSVLEIWWSCADLEASQKAQKDLLPPEMDEGPIARWKANWLLPKHGKSKNTHLWRQDDPDTVGTFAPHTASVQLC
jgi:hypothetical protein